jgi:O-methyltransferase
MRGLFYRLKGNKILASMPSFFLNTGHKAEFARWREKNLDVPFNDFFTSKPSYKKRYQLYDYLVTSNLASGPINYLEFGVREGDSFKWWVGKNQHPDTRFYGFDTFSGLPEDWLKFKAGDMSTQGKLPDITDSRVTFIKGLFQQTLPGFLQKFEGAGKRNVVLMDADLYTSTLYVLTMLDSILKPGDIICFDDFAVPHHEFLAFSNYTAAYQRKLQLVGATNNYCFSAFQVI